jgi:hypothetical protein
MSCGKEIPKMSEMPPASSPAASEATKPGPAAGHTSQPAQEQEVSVKNILIGLGVVIGLIWFLKWCHEPSSTPTPTPAPTGVVDLKAEVRFTGTQFVITNNDSFAWRNVKLEINEGLISSGYVYKLGVIMPGDTVSVGAMLFTKSDGERFNPINYKPQKLSIWCDAPGGNGSYVGEWN